MFVCKLPSAAELIELATTGENDEGHLSITENRKFISFLEQTISSLWESHLAVDLVFDPPQLHSPSPHDFFFPFSFLRSFESISICDQEDEIWECLYGQNVRQCVSVVQCSFKEENIALWSDDE